MHINKKPLDLWSQNCERDLEIKQLDCRADRTPNFPFQRNKHIIWQKREKSDEIHWSKNQEFGCLIYFQFQIIEKTVLIVFNGVTTIERRERKLSALNDKQNYHPQNGNYSFQKENKSEYQFRTFVKTISKSTEAMHLLAPQPSSWFAIDNTDCHRCAFACARAQLNFESEIRNTK